MSPSLGYRDAIHALRDLGLGPSLPILVVGAPEWVGEMRGDVSALVSALLSTSGPLLTPTFTYQTMVVPPFGPPENGLAYGSELETNAEAEIFRPDLPAHPSLGPLAETIRQAAGTKRSCHPILSFAGVDADDLLQAQTLEDPLAPIAELAARNGEVLLLGVGHSANVALHLAAQRAGRKQFVRWALTPEGVVECPNLPGCSRGFDSIVPRLRGTVREGWLGPAHLQLVPLRDLLHIASAWIRQDPAALLCDDRSCALCSAVRAAVP